MMRSIACVIFMFLGSPLVRVTWCPVASTTEASSVNVSVYGRLYALLSSSALNVCGVCTAFNEALLSVADAVPSLLNCLMVSVSSGGMSGRFWHVLKTFFAVFSNQSPPIWGNLSPFGGMGM